AADLDRLPILADLDRAEDPKHRHDPHQSPRLRGLRQAAAPAFEGYRLASVRRSSPTMTVRRTSSCAAVIVALTALAVGAARAPAQESADHPKIGFVPDGPLAVTPINRSIVRGLRRADRELGADVQVRTPSPREGYAASFEAFAKQGYDLVIGFGGLE